MTFFEKDLMENWLIKDGILKNICFSIPSWTSVRSNEDDKLPDDKNNENYGTTLYLSL